MEKLNCIVIEDEPLAAEIMQDYIAEVDFLELKGCYINALQALEVLKQSKIDVIFLDIHLPKLKGLEFLKILIDIPQVIITTAYREYALDGYELNVTDYLLKPIKFNRFLMAVNKLTAQIEAATLADVTERGYLLIIVKKLKIKAYFDEILYIESRKKYVHIVTISGTHQTRIPLSEIVLRLDRELFIRIHRSFIIAKNKVNSFSALKVNIQQHIIPIGRNYKIEALKHIHQTSN
ncbi:MAG: LytTR family DNA-binding domain-containing protein [Bacteroidota bacterium]